MYLEKLSSFVKCFKSVQINQNRTNSTLRESCDTVQKILGIPRLDARKLVKSHRLTTISKENLSDRLTILTSLGYKNEDIVQNGVLLGRSSKTLQHQYLVLKEVGFKNVSPVVLLNFRKLVHRTIKTLKALSFLPRECNVLNNLLVCLNPKPPDFFIGYEYNDDQIIAQLHAAIIKKYLEWRLDASNTEIETLFRSKTLKFKSFQYICENIDFAFNIGFTPRTLLKNTCLLTTIPSYPKTIIQEKPFMDDLDMRDAIKHHPKLSELSPENFKATYDILKSEHIPDEFIKNTMEVFTLPPKTIKFRLNELKRIPELNILRGNPRILKLIVLQKRVKSRFNIMKELDLKCINTTQLECTRQENFDSKIKSGKDVNTEYEVLVLLKNLLYASPKALKESLKQHPHYLEIPLIEIESTVKYLKMKYDNEAILNVLPIVLYPIRKIRKAAEVIKQMKDLSKGYLTDTNKLNLILYVMEKSHHFTGDGVWRNK